MAADSWSLTDIAGVLEKICHAGRIITSEKRSGDECWYIELKELTNKENIKKYLIKHNRYFIAINFENFHKPDLQKIIKDYREIGCFANKICDYILLTDEYIIFTELKSNNKGEGDKQLYAARLHWQYTESILKEMPNLCENIDASLKSQLTAVDFPSRYSYCILCIRDSGQKGLTENLKALGDEFGEEFPREFQEPLKPIRYNILRREADRAEFDVESMLSG